MTEYERQIFNGRCPYTDDVCNRDIDCFKCEVEEEERKEMEAADDQTDNSDTSI